MFKKNKTMKKSIQFLAIAALTLGLTVSCKSKAEENTDTTPVDSMIEVIATDTIEEVAEDTVVAVVEQPVKKTQKKQVKKEETNPLKPTPKVITNEQEDPTARAGRGKKVESKDVITPQGVDLNKTNEDQTRKARR